MATESGIIITSSGTKTTRQDMVRLEKVLDETFLPYSSKKLFAEFKSIFLEDTIKGTTKCEHQFGIIDADIGMDYLPLDGLPANAQLKCCKCDEMFFLFSKDELKPKKSRVAVG